MFISLFGRILPGFFLDPCGRISDPQLEKFGVDSGTKWSDVYVSVGRCCDIMNIQTQSFVDLKKFTAIAEQNISGNIITVIMILYRCI